VDGKLDEPAWVAAPWSETFVDEITAPGIGGGIVHISQDGRVRVTHTNH
jgi:hypothetical protein